MYPCLDCGLLEAWENMAFKYCPHGQDGFTWAEVQDCEVIIGYLFSFLIRSITGYLLQIPHLFQYLSTF